MRSPLSSAGFAFLHPHCAPARQAALPTCDLAQILAQILAQHARVTPFNPVTNGRKHLTTSGHGHR